MADTQSYDDQWLQSAQTHSAALENTSDVKVVDFLASDYVDSPKLTMPGVEYDQDPGLYNNAKPLRFVQFRLSSLKSLYDSASSAATNANTAATGASKVNATLLGTGGVVTLTVTDRDGNKVTKEVGFRFAKLYASYEAMQADFSGTDVNEGQFVLISSNVEDPHNAEFYVKNASAWGLMGDLSGAQGIKGDTPVITADANGVIYSDGVRVTSVIRDTVDSTMSWLSTTQTAWSNWFSDSLPTGVRKLWNDFWSSVRSSWNGFFGTSEDDPNGVRKIWSNWFSQAQSDYTTAEAARNSSYQTAEDNRDSQYQTAEDNRDQAFGEAEADRNSMMMGRRCFIDFETMCLMFVQPQADTTQYNVRNGNLNITITYDE